jgi:hypothetical protein
MVKPDVFCAGIKEKYVVQKMGVPCKQLHSYDYGGPYAGFRERSTSTKRSTAWSTPRSGRTSKPPWEEARGRSGSTPAMEPEALAEFAESELMSVLAKCARRATWALPLKTRQFCQTI